MSSEHLNIYCITTEEWLQRCVLGLNLCPFARKPSDENRVRIVCEPSEDQFVVLERLLSEIEMLDTTDCSKLETTLLVIPNLLSDFLDFNDFVFTANDLMTSRGWEGEYQLAHFHPEYQFEGTNSPDRENYTNRSPYPTLHIIRESSLSEVLAIHPDPESIPSTNIDTMNALSPKQMKAYFSSVRTEPE